MGDESWDEQKDLVLKLLEKMFGEANSLRRAEIEGSQKKFMGVTLVFSFDITKPVPKGIKNI